MRYLIATIAFLLSGVCLSVFGQPMVPQIIEDRSVVRYADIRTTLPIVVFVGAPSVSIAGAAVCEEPVGFAGQRDACVLVSWNGWRKYGVSDVDSIRRWAESEQPQAAVPFDPFSGRRSAPRAADVESSEVRETLKRLDAGARFYRMRRLYQAMSTTNNGRTQINVPTPIEEEEYHPFIVSGGMVGLSGWRSDKAVSLPDGERVIAWREETDVRAFALVNRWRWRFPDGTKFHDVLSTGAGVFEVRTRERGSDGWTTKVSFRDERNRPRGYEGLAQACSSCHNNGNTGAILDVPGRIYRRERWGSDTVYSWRPYDDGGSIDRSWPIEVR